MKKRALIVWGGWEGHEPDKVAAIFRDILEGEGFEVQVSDTLDSFKSKEELLKLALIVPAWTMGEINPAFVSNVADAVEAGVGMAGCHGGMCDAFRNNTQWQFLTGSQWVDHPGNNGIEYMVNIKKNSSSPIISGIRDFKVVSEQYYLHVDPAVNVLATTRFPVADGPYAANGTVDVPVAYTKLWGKGKIFYSSLGHDASTFNNENVKQLMKNGLIWAAR